MPSSKWNPAIVPVPHGPALMPGGILPGFFFCAVPLLTCEELTTAFERAAEAAAETWCRPPTGCLTTPQVNGD